MEKKEVINKLIEAGAVPVKDLVVKNVTTKDMETWVRVSLTLDKPVKGFVSEDDGVTYVEGETNVIFVSAFSIASLLKDNDDAAFAVNHILENPNSLMVILSRAKINILQQTIAKGEVYNNPWSDNSDDTVFDHDVIINHITSITLSKIAGKALEKIADSLLGI